MTTPKNKKLKEWVAPPGLYKTLKQFEAVCDAFFEEDEEEQKTRPIMICGPTGVGKSCFTDYFIGRYYDFIEQEFKKKQKPEKDPNFEKPEIVRVNCAAIPAGLVESTLFGHKKGAFTGATTDRTGIFNDSGRLIILEEIGELPKYIQAKLLILIEQQTFIRVGGNKEEPFDGQIIATTNRLQEDFRPDFYFRFFPFFISAIHERRSDILYYFDHFDSEILKLLSTSNVTALLSYHWPGNVREIQLFCRLFRINAKQHTITHHNTDILPGSPLEGETFSDLSKLFIISENYSKFKINNPEIFLDKILHKSDDHKINLLIKKFEGLIDNYIEFTGIDSPFKEELEHVKIKKTSIFTEIKNNENTKFYAVSNKKINNITIAFSIFCILFFRGFRANHDSLDFTNFTIPEIEFDLKKLKNRFTNFDKKELEKISLEILSLLSKKENFGQNKNLPLNYTERKEKIKELYEQNKGNKFLSELIGVPKTNHSKTEAETDIKDLTEDEIVRSYFGMLFQVTSVQKQVAEFAGVSTSNISTRLKNKQIDKENYPYTLKAYKRHKN